MGARPIVRLVGGVIKIGITFGVLIIASILDFNQAKEWRKSGALRSTTYVCEPDMYEVTVTRSESAVRSILTVVVVCFTLDLLFSLCLLLAKLRLPTDATCGSKCLLFCVDFFLDFLLLLVVILSIAFADPTKVGTSGVVQFNDLPFEPKSGNCSLPGVCLVSMDYEECTGSTGGGFALSDCFKDAIAPPGKWEDNDYWFTNPTPKGVRFFIEKEYEMMYECYSLNETGEWKEEVVDFFDEWSSFRITNYLAAVIDLIIPPIGTFMMLFV